MAMHRLPAGTEGPRWRVLAAVWAASAVLAAALAWALNVLMDLRIAHVTVPILWLAIQWALWLHLKDRPAQPRLFVLEPEPDDSPTLRLATVEEDSPDSGSRSGGLGGRAALDRPTARHALRENHVSKPTPTNPAHAVLPADRFAPFSVAQIEAAALALQTSRWNFTLIRPMQPSQANKQFETMNRYLREQVCKEAFAALTAAGVPAWPTAEPEVPASARDDVAEMDDFWNRKMEVMIDWFNPPDGDAACESIVLDAIERAYKFAESQPCQCVGGEEEHHAVMVCRRCIVLGRVRDKAVSR